MTRIASEAIRPALVLVLIAACGVQLVGCCPIAGGCDEGIDISGNLDIGAFEAVRLKLRICKNDSCGEGELDTTPLGPDPNQNPAPIQIAVDTDVYECSLTRMPETCDPGVTCGGVKSGKMRLDIRQDTPTDLEEEEKGTYSLFVVELDNGAILVDTTETLTYVERGDGGICGESCYGASMGFQPSK